MTKNPLTPLDIIIITCIIFSSITPYNYRPSPYSLPNCEKFQHIIFKDPIKYQKECILDQTKQISTSTQAMQQWHGPIIKLVMQLGNAKEQMIVNEELSQTESCRDYLKYIFGFQRRNPNMNIYDFSIADQAFRQSARDVIDDFFSVFNLIKNYDNALFFKGLNLKAHFFNFYKKILNQIMPLIEKVSKSANYEEFLENLQKHLEYLSLLCEFRNLNLSNIREQTTF